MAVNNEMIFGVRAVLEALDAGKEIDKILIKKDIQSELSRELFAALNAKRQEQPFEKVSGVSPAECVKCGKCEDICPQNLKIRELLTVAAEEL